MPGRAETHRGFTALVWGALGERTGGTGAALGSGSASGSGSGPSPKGFGARPDLEATGAASLSDLFARSSAGPGWCSPALSAAGSPSLSFPEAMAGGLSPSLPLAGSFFPGTMKSRADFLFSCFLLSLVSFAASKVAGGAFSQRSLLTCGWEDGRDIDLRASFGEDSGGTGPASPGSLQGREARFSEDENHRFFLRPWGDGEGDGEPSLVSLLASGGSA